MKITPSEEPCQKADTTTAVNFSACLANTEIDGDKPRVLLVDLDPQSNASLWLLGKTRFPIRNEQQQEKTVFRMFMDMFPREPKNFRFKDAVVQSVVRDRYGHHLVPTLDLLPNTYDAIDLEERMMTHQGVLDYLAKQLEDKEDSYDFMVFDCAPNLYYTTINALLFSNFYIIPVYPDFFSRAGVRVLCKAIHERYKEYKKFATEKAELLGIILTRIKENATLDRGRAVDLENELNTLIAQKYVSPEAILFKDDNDEPIYFNDSTQIGRSIESEAPTMFYSAGGTTVRRYAERMQLDGYVANERAQDPDKSVSGTLIGRSTTNAEVLKLANDRRYEMKFLDIDVPTKIRLCAKGTCRRATSYINERCPYCGSRKFVMDPFQV